MQTINSNSPLQLIRFKDNRFQIPQEARQFLTQFKNPLAVVTIVGKYRTGKSLFLNKVLLRSSVFKVSPTINSCTKGLWICQETVKADNHDETDVLVIDTEGFGATEETDAYNNKILLFAMLLSSYFIYNSVGSIDENSLNNLNVIANLAKQIQKTNSKDDKIDQQFPSFLWLVRDFTLNLVDKSGFSIQPKEYLQQALEIQKGTSDAIENKNKIRRMIKHFFKDRDCFTMIRPVQTQQQLQNLQSLKTNEFRSEFIEQVTLLRNKILKKVKSKRIKGRALDGEMLLQLISTYVEAINHGSLPNFQTSHRHLVKYQLNKSINEFGTLCRNKLYQKSLKMHCKQHILQVQQELLHDLQSKFKQSATQEQQQKVMIGGLKRQVKQMIAVFQKDNQTKMMRNCQDIWTQLYDESRQFATSLQIQQYFSQIVKNFEQEIHASGNPINEQYYKNIILLQKCQIMKKFIAKYHEQSQTELQSKNFQISTLQEQSANLRSSNQALDFQLMQLKREHLLLNGKYIQLQKVKQMQISYLTQKQKQNNQQITNLIQKTDQLSKELQKYRASSCQLQASCDDLTRHLRQLTEQKRLVDKQLQILKYTINSKNEQNSDLKRELSETTIRLQNALQKQVATLTRNQLELQSKTKQYSALKRVSDNQLDNISNLQKTVLTLQHELDSTKTLSQTEKTIYQSMFQNFKESLKSQSSSREGLIQTNKNLSSALKHMQKRAEQVEEKQKQLKQYKKCIKNASCLQCQHCTKFFVPSIFIPHLNVCTIAPEVLKNTKPNSKQNDSKIEIKIKQTLVKQADGKPYTEYIIDLTKNNQTWSIHRKYKAFCELHSSLKSILPGVDLSDVSYIVNPQQGNKKSLAIEERRKHLQKYLTDLSNNPLVANTLIWKQFIEEPTDSLTVSLSDSPLQQNRKTGNQQQTPEQFFKVWNERKLRGKQSSMTKKYKAPL